MRKKCAALHCMVAMLCSEVRAVRWFLQFLAFEGYPRRCTDSQTRVADHLRSAFSSNLFSGRVSLFGNEYRLQAQANANPFQITAKTVPRFAKNSDPPSCQNWLPYQPEL